MRLSNEWSPSMSYFKTHKSPKRPLIWGKVKSWQVNQRRRALRISSSELRNAGVSFAMSQSISTLQTGWYLLLNNVHCLCFDLWVILSRLTLMMIWSSSSALFSKNLKVQTQRFSSRPSISYRSSWLNSTTYLGHSLSVSVFTRCIAVSMTSRLTG